MCVAAFTDETTVTTQDANVAQNFFVFQSEWKFCLVLVPVLYIEGLGLFVFSLSKSSSLLILTKRL